MSTTMTDKHTVYCLVDTKENLLCHSAANPWCWLSQEKLERIIAPLKGPYADMCIATITFTPERLRPFTVYGCNVTQKKPKGATTLNALIGREQAPAGWVPPVVTADDDDDDDDESIEDIVQSIPAPAVEPAPQATPLADRLYEMLTMQNMRLADLAEALDTDATEVESELLARPEWFSFSGRGGWWRLTV